MEGGGGGAGLWLGPHRYYTPKRRSQIYISAGEKKKAQENPPPQPLLLERAPFFFPSKTKLNLRSSTGDLCNVPLAAPLPEPVGGGVEREPEIPFFSPSLCSHTQKKSGWGAGGQINSSGGGANGKCGSISKKGGGKQTLKTTQNGCISTSSAVGPPPPTYFRRDADELDQRRSPLAPPDTQL